MYRIIIWGSTVLSGMTEKKIRKARKEYIFTFMTEHFGFPNMQKTQSVEFIILYFVVSVEGALVFIEHWP